jgi:hypothetical protein
MVYYAAYGGMSARRRIYIGSTPLLNHIFK